MYFARKIKNDVNNKISIDSLTILSAEDFVYKILNVISLPFANQPSQLEL